MEDHVRIGFGFDVHRLVEGRPLRLGGVDIAYELGLEGHSDADVLTHAVTDAVLGAAALGDIGFHFPDSDARWKDASSSIFLERAMELIAAEGFRLVNVDVTVAAQKPKLSPHIARIKAALAAVLGLPLGSVSVKATTTERLGFVGREEGISAYAVCLIRKA